MTFRIRYLLLALLVTRTPGAVAYELNFEPEGTNRTVGSLFYPINARMFAVDLAARKAMIFCKDPGRPGRLRTPRPSKISGTVSSNSVVVTLWDDAPYVCRFERGRLVSCSRNGTETQRQADLARLTAEVSDRQRERAVRWCSNHAKDGKKYWQNSGRLRLWFNNPNDAGSLLALLALLPLSLVFRSHSAVRIAGAVLTLAALGGVLATGSRGGLAGLAVGALLLAGFRLRRQLAAHRRLAWGAVVVMAAAVVAYAWLKAVDMRSGAAVGDESTRQRLVIWRAAPQMMAAAPDGWRRPTGLAYCEWFQDMADTFRTKWMVNTHLSWMVQYGRTFRLLYPFAWFLMLGCLWCVARRGGRVLALAEWSALAVVTFFSFVGSNVYLWLVPVGALLVLLVRELCVRRFGDVCRVALPRFAIVAVLSAVLSGALYAGLMFVGRRMESTSGRSYPIVRTADGVQIGRGKPRVVLLHDNRVLNCGYPGELGRDVRSYYEDHPDAPAMLVADSARTVPPSADVLVLAGKAGLDYFKNGRDADGVFRCQTRNVVLVSPSFTPKDVPRRLYDETDIRVLLGEFAAEVMPVRDRRWRNATVVPGAACYVPDWIGRVMP